MKFVLARKSAPALVPRASRGYGVLRTFVCGAGIKNTPKATLFYFFLKELAFVMFFIQPCRFVFYWLRSALPNIKDGFDTNKSACTAYVRP